MGSGRHRETSPWPRRVGLACTVFTLFCAAACSGPAGTRVVLVTLDTLRYDSFLDSMPELQARARSCLSFERFFSSTSSTQPTHATLFTGLHPWQHGVSRNGLRLGDEHLTLAERLRRAGFTTTAVVASFPVSSRFGFAQGFDQFDEEFDREFHVRRWEDVEGPGDEAFYTLASAVTDRAIARLDGASSERQFFWFHYFDPHAPYGDSAAGPLLRPRQVLRQVSGGADRERLLGEARRLYDADVAYLDQSLARLLRRLDRDRRRFETHLVLVSDHGESLGEDGSMAHGKRLTPGQIHVPCLVCSPRVGAGGRRDPAGSIDVGATMLSLAGVSPGFSAGRDLTSSGAGGAPVVGMRRTFETPYRELRLDGRVRVHAENLFYVVDADGEIYRGNGTGLFERPRGESPAEAERIAAGLQELFASFEAELEGHPAEKLVDPETREALEALGYVP